jgi:RND family efflux transporter MFP subunit
MNLKTMNQTILSKLETSPLWHRVKNSKLHHRFGGKALVLAAAVVILMAGVGFAYYQLSYLPSQTVKTDTMQTAVARTGDLVIYASGTGTLIAADEVDLAFSTSGQVKAVYFKVGDEVQKGDLLAEVDDTDARIKYTQAKRNLLELTSVAAIASAEQAVAAAETDLVTAINQLSYLISPEVYYWDVESEDAELEVERLKQAVDADPNNQELQQELKDAEAYLDYAEDKLIGSKYYYKNEYLELTFTAWDRTTGKKYIAAPSAAEISEAHAAVTGAKATLQEAQYLYTALTGGEVPEDATGSGLSELESAQLDLEAAQVTLDGTKIYASISGTIMSIDTSVGDTAGTGTVITVADLSQYYLETFLDETDWNNVAVGYETEIIFDALPEKTLAGKVTQVDPGLYTSGNTSVVRAIVRLDAIHEEIHLPIGTSAAVDVIGGRAENAVLVPVEALHQAGEGYAVFVMENGEPRLHVVELGIQDLLYAEIKSGVNPGDIVTTGITGTQ